MDDTSHSDLFLLSLNRCAENDWFIPTFYRHFLASSDEVKQKFLRTDMKVQGRLLLKSLLLAAGAASGDPESLRDLRERAASHDRNHLDIRPHLYEFWRSSLIKTAAEFDPHWSHETEVAWHATLGHIVQVMIDRY